MWSINLPISIHLFGNKLYVLVISYMGKLLLAGIRDFILDFSRFLFLPLLNFLV